MTTDDVVAKLEHMLHALKFSNPDYETKAFRVWDGRAAVGRLPEIIRVEYDSWSWGCCRSDTCSHVSHDPYCEGDTVFISCREIGKDNKQRQLFVTPMGTVFVYEYRSNGHYSPSIKLEAIEEEDI